MEVKQETEKQEKDQAHHYSWSRSQVLLDDVNPETSRLSNQLLVARDLIQVRDKLKREEKWGGSAVEDKERERERNKEKQRERERNRERERKREKNRDRERERDKERETDRQREEDRD